MAIAPLLIPDRQFGQPIPVAPDMNQVVDKVDELVVAVNAGLGVSNAVVGGPKYVQYRLSGLYGVPAEAQTLDRLNPATILPGNQATVINSSDMPMSTTAPQKQYVATIVPAGTAEAVAVPAYAGASSTVLIVWQEVVSADSFTVLLASELSANKKDYANKPLRPLLIKLINELNTGSTTVTVPADNTAPKAPTSGQVDDEANTFSGIAVTGFASYAEYEATGIPGTTGIVALTADNSYQSGTRIYLKNLAGPIAKGAAGFRVAASGNRPAGAFLLNLEAFTGPALTPTPLATPTGLAVTPVNATLGTSWNLVSGATGYRLQRALVSGAAIGSYQNVYTGTDTNYIDAGVAAGSTYAYRVLTLGDGSTTSNSDYSAPVQATAASGNAKRLNYTAIGDSRTFGFDTPNPATDSYPGQLQTLEGSTYYKINNQGYSNETTGNMLGHLAAFQATIDSSYDYNIFSDLCDVNDIGQGYYPSQAIANKKELHGKLLAMPGCYGTFAITSFPVKNPTLSAGCKEVTDAVLAQAVSQWGCFGVLDFFNDPDFNANDSSQFPDGLHPSKACLAIAAQKIKDFLDAKFNPLGVPKTPNGNTTPAAPLGAYDDMANTVSYSSLLGNSEILISINQGTFGPYAGPYNVGDVDVPAGYYRAKTRAAAGRNESATVSSPAFTQAATGPVEQRKRVAWMPSAANSAAITTNQVTSQVSGFAPGGYGPAINDDGMSVGRIGGVEWPYLPGENGATNTYIAGLAPSGATANDYSLACSLYNQEGSSLQYINRAYGGGGNIGANYVAGDIMGVEWWRVANGSTEIRWTYKGVVQHAEPAVFTSVVYPVVFFANTGAFLRDAYVFGRNLS